MSDRSMWKLLRLPYPLLEGIAIAYARKRYA